MSEAHKPAGSGLEFSIPQRMDMTELGLQAHGEVNVERFERPVDNLERAGEVFARDGAVTLSSECQLTLPNGEMITVGELTEEARGRAIEDLLAIWASDNRDDIIKRKHYDAYNGTQRDMRTVSFENVEAHFKHVLDMQASLLPAIREITRDPSVEISIDPDEGTVINLQLFPKSATPDARQEHGAHTDRVDVTTVTALDNVGPNGEFVYIKGYNAACRQLSLSPHRFFTQNAESIAQEAPQSVIYRRYPIRPGELTIIRTDQDVHFITPKTKADVDQGAAEGHQPVAVGEDLLLGRGIINAAFETERSRMLYEQAMSVKQAAGLDKLRGDAFFEAMDAYLNTLNLEPDHRADLENALVTSMSAEQLYND